jgi:hypothetical protein
LATAPEWVSGGGPAGIVCSVPYNLNSRNFYSLQNILTVSIGFYYIINFVDKLSVDYYNSLQRVDND